MGWKTNQYIYISFKMAEREAEQVRDVPNPTLRYDNSDNESVSSSKPVNTQSLTRFDSKFRDEMGSIASQVKETVLGMNQQ